MLHYLMLFGQTIVGKISTAKIMSKNLLKKKEEKVKSDFVWQKTLMLDYL